MYWGQCLEDVNNCYTLYASDGQPSRAALEGLGPVIYVTKHAGRIGYGFLAVHIIEIRLGGPCEQSLFFKIGSHATESPAGVALIPVTNDF
jgi:hypothetical protein